jgi:hypothetical protein
MPFVQKEPEAKETGTKPTSIGTSEGRIYPVKFNIDVPGYGKVQFEFADNPKYLYVKCDAYPKDKFIEFIVESQLRTTDYPMFEDSENLDLDPGENKVTMILSQRAEKIDTAHKELWRKSFTVLGEGKIINKNGVTFVLEGKKEDILKKYNDELWTQLTEIVFNMNSILSEDSGIKFVTIQWNEKGYDAGNMGSCIEFDSGLFNYGDAAIKAVFMHESAHALAKEILKDRTTDDRIDGIYPEVWTPINNLFSRLEQRAELFDFFDESSYISLYAPISYEMGHPNEGDRELFASTSGILAAYPNEFMARVRTLNIADEQLVLEVASQVIAVYAQRTDASRFFSPETLKFIADERTRLQASGTLQNSDGNRPPTRNPLDYSGQP